MVNVHGKYTENAVNNTAYRTDGSDIRDATAEEKLRYPDANKHKRKKGVGTASSGDLSKVDTAENIDASSKSRPMSARGEQSGRDVSGGDTEKCKISSEKSRGTSRKNADEESVAKSSDRESSRKRESREHSTKTARNSEGGDNEDEDQRMMNEIKMRMEARKIARDIETAHERRDSSKASRDSTSSITAKSSKKIIEQEKKEVGRKAGAPRGVKKPVVIEVSAGVIDVKSPAVITSIPRDGETSDLAGIGGTVGTTVPIRGRVSKRTVTGERDDAALSTLKFSAMTEAGSRVSAPVGDAQDTDLGIALVASALGKKVPRGTLTSIALVTKECRVEVAISHKKTIRQTSVAPPNSIDSDEAGCGDLEAEIRLSQSDVRVEFPGESSGTVAISVANDDSEGPSIAVIAGIDYVATRVDADLGVAAHEEIDGAPPEPGEIATPLSESATDSGEILVIPDLTRTPTNALIVPGSEEDKVARRARVNATQERVREIAANQLLQEELAKIDPNLACVSSFLSRVCGVD